MKITKSIFGYTSSNEEVIKYTLINNNGSRVSILNYGGIITNIDVPDRDGTISNVVLGYDRFDDYKQNASFFGAIAGRFAGRISNGAFTIDNRTYQLPKNDRTNCLHGGLKGFDQVIWSVTTIEDTAKVSLILNYLSKDMEEGFPGNLDVTVTYTWNDDNQLTIDYTATTDKDTVCTLTNHSYFNLSNDLTKDILDQELMIKADQYLELDDVSIPMKISSTENTPFDFRVPKKVGQDINAEFEQLKNTSGYDHPFIFSDNDGVVASLYCNETGRLLGITTDLEAVVLYTGNHLTDALKISGTTCTTKHGALCLETQHIPDNINFEPVKTHILRAGDVYRTSTSYSFTVK